MKKLYITLIALLLFIVVANALPKTFITYTKVYDNKDWAMPGISLALPLGSSNESFGCYINYEKVEATYGDIEASVQILLWGFSIGPRPWAMFTLGQHRVGIKITGAGDANRDIEDIRIHIGVQSFIPIKEFIVVNAGLHLTPFNDTDPTFGKSEINVFGRLGIGISL
jgi:hypothetical protein